MTGRYSIRSGLSLVAVEGTDISLPAKEITMAEVLHDAGYATAIFGKWHLGGQPYSQPQNKGFDEFYGIPPAVTWDAFPTFARLVGGRVPNDRPIDGIDQGDLLLGTSDTGHRESLLTFVGPDLVAARWKQFRAYFADVAPGRSGEGGSTLMGGVGTSAAPMNGYPRVFNIESDPREEHNIGEMYEWVLGPFLKTVEEYKASLAKYPNPPAANMTRF
jgi:hypothetical protein